MSKICYITFRLPRLQLVTFRFWLNGDDFWAKNDYFTSSHHRNQKKRMKNEISRARAPHHSAMEISHNFRPLARRFPDPLSRQSPSCISVARNIHTSIYMHAHFRAPHKIKLSSYNNSFHYHNCSRERRWRTIYRGPYILYPNYAEELRLHTMYI